MDPEESYKMFLNKITLAYDKAFLFVKKKTEERNTNPGLPKGLKNPSKQKINYTSIILIYLQYLMKPITK